MKPHQRLDVAITLEIVAKENIRVLNVAASLEETEPAYKKLMKASQELMLVCHILKETIEEAGQLSPTLKTA